MSAGQGDTNGASNNTGSVGDMQDVNSPLQGVLHVDMNFSPDYGKVSELYLGLACTQVHLGLAGIAIEQTTFEP